MIDWTRLETDNEYRAHVFTTIAATPQGREYLARLAESADDLPMGEAIVLQARLGIITATSRPAVSGVSALRGLATGLRQVGGKFSPWVKNNVTPALSAAWTALKGGGRPVAQTLMLAGGAFFATDWVVSKVKGNKPEIEKLYQAGRQVLGSTVSTASTLISLLPIALVAWAAYHLFVASKTPGK